MFYSQDILQRRGGKFGIIWIAATKAAKLSKRDYFTVNISKTCDDLLAYIMLQANPLRPGAARPRFSLYLSSQLMYGVIKVYDRQQQYLFTDASNLSTRFRLVAAPLMEIDLRDIHRSDHADIVDVVDTFRRQGDVPAEDPCFGLLKSIDVIDWELIPDVDVWCPPTPRMDLLPDYDSKDILFPSSPRTPKYPFRPVFGSPLQARPEMITLIEEPLQGLEGVQVPGEEDLPPLRDDALLELGEIKEPQDFPSVDTIEPLMSPKTDQISSPPSDKRTDVPTDDGSSKDITRELDNLEQQLDLGRLPPTEETPMVFPDIDMLNEPPPLAQAVSRSPQRTPGTPPPNKEQRRKKRVSMYEMALSSTDVTPSASGRRRRRQLFIFDSEIQIPRRQIRGQMENKDELSEPFEPAGEVMPTAKQLLSQPSNKGFRHRRLLPLWTRNAISRDFPDTDSDKGRPSWTVPNLNLSADSSSGSERGSMRGIPMTLGEPPLSPVLEVPEEPRGLMDSRLGDTVEELRHTLEQSRVDHSRLITPIPNLSLGISRDQDLLSQSSFAKDSEKRPSSRRRRGSTDNEKSSDDVTLIEEQVELETVPEVPEEQLISPTHQGPRATSSPSSDSPRKRRKIHVEEEMEERLQSPAHLRLLSHVRAQTEMAAHTTFEDVCPFTYNRHQASRLFAALLNFAAVQTISVHQEEPYADIYIMRGLSWT